MNNRLNPEYIAINTLCEVVALHICTPIELILISSYRPPSTPISKYTDEMLEIISLFDYMKLCLVGDFNEDILLREDTTLCSAMK